MIKKLGLKESISLVLGNVIGTGILNLPIALAAIGSISLFGWLVTGAGAIILSLVFAALSRKYPETGGPYAYSHKAFGDLVGFQVAWSHWIATWVGNASAVIGLMAYVNAINLDPNGALAGLLQHISTQLQTALPGIDPKSIMNISASLFIIWFLTWLNTLGVNIFAKIQNTLTIAKLIPLFFIAIIGTFYIDLENIFPLTLKLSSMDSFKYVTDSNSNEIFSAVAASAAITLYAFIGIESATIPAEKVKSADKTIPTATIVGTILVTIFYLWISIVLFAIVPENQLCECTAPFSSAIEKMFGISSGNLMSIFGAFIGLSVLNGWIMIQGQIPMAAAKDGVFPTIFAKTNKNGLPTKGLIITSALMSALLLMNYNASLIEQFNIILEMTVFSVLLPYLYSSVAYMYFVATGKEKMNHYQFYKRIILSIIAFAYSLWMIASIGSATVYLGVILTLAGLVLFAFSREKRK